MKNGKLALVAAQKFFRLRRKSDRPELLAKLRSLLGDIVDSVTQDERNRVNALLARTKEAPLRAPPELVEWLRDRAGRWVLVNRVLARAGPIGRGQAEAVVNAMIAVSAEPQRLLEAAIRFGAGKASKNDESLIERSFQQIAKKENAMPSQKVKFSFDPRGLPAGFSPANEQPFKDAVTALLRDTFGLPDVDDNKNTYAAIIGILLLNEQADQTAVTFRDAVREAWDETLNEVTKNPLATPPKVSSRVAYETIAQKLGDPALNLVPLVDDTSTTPPGKIPTISFQQFAFVARFVISKSDDVFLDHPNLSAQIRIGLDQYVGGQPLFESLELPPLGDDAQIVDDNVRAVGTLAACYFLEKARLIDVLDSVVGEFVVGKVPIGFDAAGRALDEYRSIPKEQLLSVVERHSVYSRALGYAGGDVPKDVLPNQGFDTLLQRFIAAVAEYDRQRRVSLFFNSNNGAQRPLSYTGELVRKAGNDLGRNASLYGYAGTQFDARRVTEMVQRTLKILSIQSLQRAYGVTNVYLLVERVASANLGQQVNVVKYKTMAESVKAIFDIIAKYAPVWSRTGGTPLFTEDTAGSTFNTGVAARGDVADADRDELINRVQYWLAVTGTGDQQVEKLSQPVETKPSPSIPLLGGGSGSAADANAIDKLRQMVTSGSAPSIDQIKSLLPTM